MRKLHIKIFVIGIYCLLVSALDQKSILIPGESRPTEHEIGYRIEIETDGDGGVVESPKFRDIFFCGYDQKSTISAFGILSGKEGDRRVPLYYLNATAEKLASKGFNIRVNKVRSDVLYNFTFSYGTHENTFAYERSRSADGDGKFASNVRWNYMAQIGEKKDGKIKWLCDGVLINPRWIISAAHCFIERGIDLNVVGLGHLYKSDFEDTPEDIVYEFIHHYAIHQLVPYPEYKINEIYHDIVLIEISRPVPQVWTHIHQICLPWGKETNKDLVGMNLTLTGFGPTQYGGPKTTELQEVNLTVFETSVCDDAYSDSSTNRISYPQGITEDKLLCAGWKDGGKDDCAGGSGAPISYYHEGKFMLAGIFSRRLTCGSKEFPGLYIPINKPNYLKWIKEVAFKDYV